MIIRDGYNSKKVVTFDTQDRLDVEIDKLTSMMAKLTAQDSSQNRPFKPKIYQGKRRRQTRDYYVQGKYQNRYRLNSGDRRMSYRGRAQYGENSRGSLQYAHNYRSDLGEEFLEEHTIIEVKILEVELEVIVKKTTLKEEEEGLEKDSIQVILEEMIKAVVDKDQV